MAPKAPSEEILGRKWDRCLADATIKLGTGTLIGAVFSLIFFKRKSWPVTFGAGIGLGIGYANCQHTFYSQFPPHHKFGPPWWQKNPEVREKWMKQWEERWKSSKPKEVVDVEKDVKKDN
ncbi:MICOS complex subunit Mic10-like [Dendronephthya gigantea]|uniref:MICOS complex subunit Mic10-like n=1 Tax=Dendronephthya gigantea TaxID=151771 RepID=UPI001068D5A2|nr:MICOS complex subunit Mic10-like [Dendronephthya gigantea]